jgi:hypothetical protein
LKRWSFGRPLPVTTALCLSPASASPPKQPRPSPLDNLANWPRLRMTILETLRLYPPVPHLVLESVVGSAYHPMGSRGMGEMGSMEMPAPDNTLPMITGYGQFGPIEMGGMFTVVKVREDIVANDYNDPGWYQHPQGAVAYEWQGDAPAESQPAPANIKVPGRQDKARDIELKAVKPDANRGHEH